MKKNMNTFDDLNALKDRQSNLSTIYK